MSEDQFKRAAYFIANSPPKEGVTNEQKLEIYGLFKQATIGDNNTSQPWSVQFEASAKWKAWDQRRGLSQEDARQKYIDLVTNGDPNWESSEVMKNYK